MFWINDYETDAEPARKTAVKSGLRTQKSQGTFVFIFELKMRTSQSESKTVSDNRILLGR